jgi:hypothetical protein
MTVKTQYQASRPNRQESICNQSTEKQCGLIRRTRFRPGPWNNWRLAWNRSAHFIKTEALFDPFCALVRAEGTSSGGENINGVRAAHICIRGAARERSRAHLTRARALSCTLYVKHLFKSFPNTEDKLYLLSRAPSPLTEQTKPSARHVKEKEKTRRRMRSSRQGGEMKFTLHCESERENALSACAYPNFWLSLRNTNSTHSSQKERFNVVILRFSSRKHTAPRA